MLYLQVAESGPQGDRHRGAPTSWRAQRAEVIIATDLDGQILLIELHDGPAWSTLIIMNKLASERGGVVRAFFQSRPLPGRRRPPG